jgi:hypothetical protein
MNWMLMWKKKTQLYKNNKIRILLRNKCYLDKNNWINYLKVNKNKLIFYINKINNKKLIIQII